MGLVQTRIEHLNQLMDLLGRRTRYTLAASGRVVERTGLGFVTTYPSVDLPEMIAGFERKIVERSVRAARAAAAS